MSGPTGFLGLSHLGIVSSIGWASFGEAVVAVDLDRGPVERLGRGELPVHEPALDALFARVRGAMTFSTDPAALGACPLVIVARDVPTDATNTSDPAVVLEAMGLGAAATKYNLFASLSNTPIAYMTLVDGWAHTQGGAGAMLQAEAAICLTGIVVFMVSAALAHKTSRFP